MFPQQLLLQVLSNKLQCVKCHRLFMQPPSVHPKVNIHCLESFPRVWHLVFQRWLYIPLSSENIEENEHKKSYKCLTIQCQLPSFPFIFICFNSSPLEQMSFYWTCGRKGFKYHKALGSKKWEKGRVTSRTNASKSWGNCGTFFVSHKITFSSPLYRHVKLCDIWKTIELGTR